MSKTNQAAEKKRQSNIRTALIAIAILILTVIAILIFQRCNSTGTEPTNDPGENIHSGIVYDDNAQKGGWDEADTDKIIDSLNRKVEEGMINISMNTTPVFADGKSFGNLMIVNEEINRYPQIVEIKRNDTDEVIYKSGAIAVGSKIEEAKLDAELEAGEYECTAMFYNADPETGAYLGCAGAVISITVLK